MFGTKLANLEEVVARSKFQKHVATLVWKCQTQRRRRWRLLVIEVVFASIMFVIAIFIALPVFLTPLEDEPDPPVTFSELLGSLDSDTIVGYAPNTEPFKSIMTRAAALLNVNFYQAKDLLALNALLYSQSGGQRISRNVTWVLWKETKPGDVYQFSIQSTALARTMEVIAAQGSTGGVQEVVYRNKYLETGFLAIQVAVSHALLEHAAAAKGNRPKVKLTLRSMPVSPLMEEHKVRRAISLILMCYTIALLPPVLETEALVVTETRQRFKRALRIRSVDYMTMYLAWLSYALLTAIPICLLGSITLIFTFRWIHLFYAGITLLLYFLVMMMLALIMSMAHTKALISCVWTTCQTLLQTFLAELMVHHRYDDQSIVLNFIIHMFMPPLGLLCGLNQFALIQTGRDTSMSVSMEYTILSWVLLIVVYFMLLMLLQRTVGNLAIGGQVSWKSIIFKRAVDPNALQPILKPRHLDEDKLQKVDSNVAKAISFRNVSKTIMNVPILKHLTFDLYRGEYSIIVAERTQDKTMICMGDLLTGTTYADSGIINVLGVELNPGRNLMTEPMMMGYCDQTSFLIDDLTVEEHFTLYAEILLWKRSNRSILEYTLVRSQTLKKECDLEGLENKMIRELGNYYRAQLCWAIAVLIEPRIIVVPIVNESPVYEDVIKDKIVNYRKFTTIVKITLSSMNVISADRIFLIDNRVLAFGGSPAYMFFKFGHDYRLRLTTKTFNDHAHEEECMEELLDRLHQAGADIRAHTGSLIIFRIPTKPTNVVASLLKDIEVNADKYAVLSVNVSLPDPEEVFRRAIHESRVTEHVVPNETRVRSEVALSGLEDFQWKRRITFFNNYHLRTIGWKYFSFYIHYRFFFIVTIIFCLLAGATIGYDLGAMVKDLHQNVYNSKLMTVEYLNKKTILAISLDHSENAYSVVQQYVMSSTNSRKHQASEIGYIALYQPQFMISSRYFDASAIIMGILETAGSLSLKEFLVTKAIDSPQDYVHLHAYGMIIKETSDTLNVTALYGPAHADKAAAVRSLARVYMALMRHYTGVLTADVEVTDDPLLTENLVFLNTKRALLIQFLLVLTISHIVLMPSKEHGLVRHTQMHALNFSPVGYWCSLAICDFIHYAILIMMMICVVFTIFFFMASKLHISLYTDLLIIPCMLLVHGLGCVPQAYLFSLGPRSSLNSMALIIVNLVFGEATIIAKFFYGELYTHALNFLYLSPQYNMAVALMKIKKGFQHNAECFIYKAYHRCNSTALHRCCPSCGVLQDCFVRTSYLDSVLTEIIGTLAGAIFYSSLLMLWEYRLMQLVYNFLVNKLCYTPVTTKSFAKEGAMREKADVLEKENELKKSREARKRMPKITFGEYLLAVNVSKKVKNEYVLRNVYLGLGKGEVLAVAGMKAHGRLYLCEVLAGYLNHDEGRIYAMSKYRKNCAPHNYAKNVGLCTDADMLPDWMSVYDALEMVAVLRGVPWKHVHTEIKNYIHALNLTDQKNLLVCRLRPTEKKRLNFAATVVGAPPILAMDECSAYQNYVVRRAMYHILKLLRKRGHAILHCGFDMETHLPLTNRLAIIRDGCIYDVDYVETMLDRYSKTGYIVVVHLNDKIDVVKTFHRYFKDFTVNDQTDTLSNMQVLDELSWGEVFEKMELLQTENKEVNSYIVCGKPIDYIYYEIISNAKGCKLAEQKFGPWITRITTGAQTKIKPPNEKVAALQTFETKYGLTKLEELPWSVIFYRDT